MKKNHFKLFLVLLLLVAFTTTIGYATGIVGIVDKVKDEVAYVAAGIIVIFTLMGAAQTASKQAYPQTLITVVFGFALAYIVAAPDTMAAIINATIKGIVG